MILTIDEIIDILKTTPDFFVHIYHKLSESDLLEIKKHKYPCLYIPVDKLNMDLIDKLNFVNMKTNDNAINFLVEFLYDMRALTFSPSVVWRGGIFDKNRPVYPIYIRKVSLSKMVVDWLFRMIKSGVVVTKEI